MPERDGLGEREASRPARTSFVTLWLRGSEHLLGHSSQALPFPLQVIHCVCVSAARWQQASCNTSSEAEEETNRRGQVSSPRKILGAAWGGLRKGRAVAQSCPLSERGHPLASVQCWAVGAGVCLAAPKDTSVPGEQPLLPTCSPAVVVMAPFMGQLSLMVTRNFLVLHLPGLAKELSNCLGQDTFLSAPDTPGRRPSK